MRILLGLFFLGMAMASQAQSKVETRFRVEGICGMCEDRIEAVLDVAGVVAADWDLATKELMVVYKPKKISEEQLHVLLNSVGHDTQSRKASDQEYAGIHSCCKYRESEGCSEGNDRKN